MTVISLLEAARQRKRLLLVGTLLVTCAGLAENGADGWVRYARLDSRKPSRYGSLSGIRVGADGTFARDSRNARTGLADRGRNNEGSGYCHREGGAGARSR